MQLKFNFVGEFERLTEEAETPRIFIHFSALSMLSAVASPNVYLDRVYYKLQPNLYVILIAPSGVGKGFPVSEAKRIVKAVNCTRVIEGRNSIQSVIKEMGTMRTSQNGSGPILKDSRAFLCTGEFADFLTYDQDAFTILTDLYDSQWNKEWKNSFKNTGVDVLKAPTLTLFGASALAHFKAKVPTASITGGFIGRTLLVRADKRGRINPLTEGTRYETGELIEFLSGLKDVKGTFRYSQDGKKFFDEWYPEFRANQEKMPDETGVVERLQDHVLKLAMLYQLAEDYSELVITKENVEKSIRLCNIVIKSAKRNFIESSPGELEGKIHMGKVMSILTNRPPDFSMSRADMLRQSLGQFNVNELDMAIEYLKQGELVVEYTHKNRPYYRLTPKARMDYADAIREQFKKS